MHRSSHGLAGMFIGYSINWLNNISSYLQDREDYSAQHVPYTPNNWQMLLKPTSARSSAKAYIKIVGKYDKDEKTQSVLITGTPDELIALFVNYWDDTNFSLNEIKRGGYIYKDFGSDRITFDWKGVNPKINIYRNPDAPKVAFGGK
jgi:hypothetical protein